MDEHDPDGAPTSNEAPKPPVHKERTAKDTALILDQLQQEHLRGIAKRSEAEKAAKEKVAEEVAAAELAAAEERVRDELIAEIIAASGSCRCFASTKKEHGFGSHSAANGEFPPTTTTLIDRELSLSRTDGGLAKARAAAGVFESVTIQPFNKRESRTTTRQIPNTGVSKLWRSTVDHVETTLIEVPVTMEEAYPPGHPALATGDGEVAILKYLAQVPTQLPLTPGEKSTVKYYVPDGRPGALFHIEVVIPKLVANTVASQIRLDPYFVRALVENLVETRFNTDATRHISKEWTDSVNPLRPPYEAWDEYAKEHNLDGKRRICFIDALDEPGVDPLDPKAIATHILQY